MITYKINNNFFSFSGHYQRGIFGLLCNRTLFKLNYHFLSVYNMPECIYMSNPRNNPIRLTLLLSAEKKTEA